MKAIHKRIGWAVAMTATVACIGYAIASLKGQDLSAYTTPRSLWGVAVCALFYATTVPIGAWAWRRLLLSYGVDKTWADLTRVMSVSQLGKYIPGNVGAHLGRASMGAHMGIPAKPMVQSMLLEAAAVALAALAVGVVCLALSGRAWFFSSPWQTLLALAIVCVATVFAHRILEKRVSWMPPLPILGAAFFAYLGVYLVVGLGLTLMAIIALPSGVHYPALWCASFALGWVAGFFTPAAPAGLGVREGVMLSILQAVHTPSDALFLVLGLRLATLAADGMVFLLGSFSLLANPMKKESVVMPANAMKLEPTGERMIEEHYLSSPQDHVIHLMHLATYRFAEEFARNKRVLDYGCGSGYGSARMSQVAHSVVGVDVAPDAIAYATGKFSSPNLSFQVIDPAQPLPFGDACFDTVLSFQVFEHVADTQAYLSEIKRVLAPGGVLLLATPDRSTRLLPGQRPWNRWHLHEYAGNELDQVLKRHFPRVEMLGMGGKPEVLKIEIDRCSKIKWLTLPFTLPFLPDWVRLKGLNLIHRLRGAKARSGTPTASPFSMEDIEIRQGITPSVNLVAIAQKAPTSPAQAHSP